MKPLVLFLLVINLFYNEHPGIFIFFIVLLMIFVWIFHGIYIQRKSKSDDILDTHMDDILDEDL